MFLSKKKNFLLPLICAEKCQVHKEHYQWPLILLYIVLLVNLKQPNC